MSCTIKYATEEEAKEAKREKARQRYYNNKEKMREQQKEYYHKNRQIINQYKYLTSTPPFEIINTSTPIYIDPHQIDEIINNGHIVYNS